MVNETIIPAVSTVVYTTQYYIYKLAVGIAILLVGFILGLLMQKFLRRILHEIGLNRIMSNVNVTYDLEKLVSLVASYLIYLFTIVIFLDQFNIKYTTVLYLILGAILVLIILSVVVGLRDVFPNFVAWMYLQKKGGFKEGHHIEIREISGIVEKIGYLETEIKTEQGDLLYVPNSLFLKSKHRLRR